MTCANFTKTWKEHLMLLYTAYKMQFYYICSSDESCFMTQTLNVES